MNLSKDFGNRTRAAKYLVEIHDKNAWENIVKFIKEAYTKNNNYELDYLTIIFAEFKTPESAKLFVELEKQYSILKNYLSPNDYKSIHELATRRDLSGL